MNFSVYLLFSILFSNFSLRAKKYSQSGKCVAVRPQKARFKLNIKQHKIVRNLRQAVNFITAEQKHVPGGKHIAFVADGGRYHCRKLWWIIHIRRGDARYTAVCPRAPLNKTLLIPFFPCLSASTFSSYRIPYTPVIVK